MSEKIYELAKRLTEIQRELAKQTLFICEPEVDSIITSQSTNVERIEHTLDALVEVAFDEKGIDFIQKIIALLF